MKNKTKIILVYIVVNFWIIVINFEKQIDLMNNFKIKQLIKFS